MSNEEDPYLTSKTAYFDPKYGKEIAKYLSNNPYPRKYRNRQKAHHKIPKKFAYKNRDKNND